MDLNHRDTENTEEGNPPAFSSRSKDTPRSRALWRIHENPKHRSSMFCAWCASLRPT